MLLFPDIVPHLCSTTVFSHSQTVVVCSSCSAVLCTPTGGKARLTEGVSDITTQSYSAHLMLNQLAKRRVIRAQLWFCASLMFARVIVLGCGPIAFSFRV